jgi:methylase of polypeptide subunit release factors
LQEALDALVSPKQMPFVWDIAFVEIFGGDNDGFDIVIGNPPYVRQEQISDPLLPRTQVTTENKRAYKKKLANTVYHDFPAFFQYKPATGKAGHELDAKSDLYIYFYLHGLKLLNTRGTFCFITSNSWLDVGYGADLQEFLLNYCRVKMILDNQGKRSFATADVNTIIALFSAPATKPGVTELQNIARFVMFRVDFEQILEADVFKAIERTEERTVTDSYRVYAIRQQALLADGYKYPTVENNEEAAPPRSNKGTSGALVKESPAVYDGNKWGGKYLRAPAIYWTILEKGKNKLMRLGDIAEVRFGIKTGANEFFYLDAAKIRQWQIEDEFLQPVIKSPKECKSILIDPNTLKFKLFVCHKSKAELKGTAALKYIEWGEKQAFRKNPSVANRAKWWSITPESANSIFVKEANDTSVVFFNPDEFVVDCRLYYADLSIDTLLYLNSAVGAMLFEIYNRARLGEGARSMMVSDYNEVLVLEKIKETAENTKRALQSIYSLPPRKVTDYKDQEWLNIDSIVFDTLGLTQGERDAVYEAVIELVESRLKKASSLDGKKDVDSRERKKRLEAVERTLGIWIGLPEEEYEGEEEVENYYA